MKSAFSFQDKYKILLFLNRFKDNSSMFKPPKLQHPIAFFFLSADYGNLGDVAISYAQKKFIEDNSKYKVVEIPISKSLEGFHFVKKHIKKGDIISIVGGGNMGEIYDQIEYLRQLVVKKFPNNRIISFPQSFLFSDTIEGKKAKLKAKKVYEKHRDLHLFAREEVSYELMKSNFDCNVYLTPDIVMSLNKTLSGSKRSGITLCLRDDKESAMTGEQRNSIKTYASELTTDVKYYDTHIGNVQLNSAEGELELHRIWKAFSTSELVITDRLHGMIFCAITGTPCIVIPNNNHKIVESYKWLEKDKNIFLVNEITKDTISNLFKTIDIESINLFKSIVNEDFNSLNSLLK